MIARFLTEDSEACDDRQGGVPRVRLYQKNLSDLSTAVDRALDEMSDDYVIKPFLVANKAEVKLMCITEYDEEKNLAEQREEAKEEGVEEGIAIGEKKALSKH